MSVATNHTEDGRKEIAEWKKMLDVIANDFRIDTVINDRKKGIVKLYGYFGRDKYIVILEKG